MTRSGSVNENTRNSTSRSRPTMNLVRVLSLFGPSAFASASWRPRSSATFRSSCSRLASASARDFVSGSWRARSSAAFFSAATRSSCRSLACWSCLCRSQACAAQSLAVSVFVASSVLRRACASSRARSSAAFFIASACREASASSRSRSAADQRVYSNPAWAPVSTASSATAIASHRFHRAIGCSPKPALSSPSLEGPERISICCMAPCSSCRQPRILCKLLMAEARPANAILSTVQVLQATHVDAAVEHGRPVCYALQQCPQRNSRLPSSAPAWAVSPSLRR